MDVAEAEQLGRAGGGLGEADPPLCSQAWSQEIREPRHLLGNLCCPEAQVIAKRHSVIRPLALKHGAKRFGSRGTCWGTYVVLKLR
jgi:hypothetical protein